MPGPRFFASADEFRRWLESHHDSATEIVVGFYRVETGKPTMSWSESVREAICFGWIDGHVKRIDDTSYTRRFTPRKASSIWSTVNIRHAEQLIADGRMRAAGLAAFNARTAKRSGVYSFEQESIELPEQFLTMLRANKKALEFWELQPASYRRAAAWWIVNAKQEATRIRRQKSLLDYCRKGERVPQFVSSKGTPASAAKERSQ
jgi:uncharacterized protein YdeI (YjbR/CyaY-like superfamily)